MLTEELIEKYRKIFILCVEAEGQRTGDRFLSNVESKINNIDLEDFIAPRKLSDLCLGELVSIYLSILSIPDNFGDSVSDIIQSSKLVEEYSKKALDLYMRVLKKVSDDFCSANNIKYM